MIQKFNEFLNENQDLSQTLILGAQVIDFTKVEGNLSLKKKDNGKIYISGEASEINASPYIKKFIGKFKNGYILFQEYKRDMDGSGEDLYGTHYKSLSGKYEFLIIND